MGISSLSLICPCMICSKRKNIQRKTKAKWIKMNQNAFKYGCKHVSRRCESYWVYFKDDSPHQVVMIMCELNWFSHISNRHNMRHLCTLAMISHTTRKFFAIFDTCAGTIWFGHTRDTCVNIYSLNCLNLFLKYKIG